MTHANKVMPDELAMARETIGLSLSTVAKLTGINRNNLSKYEKENGSLTLGEKKKLITLYEERGYDFDSPEVPDKEAIREQYQVAQENAESAAKQASTGDITGQKLSDMMMAYLDATHDVLVANGALDLNTQEKKLPDNQSYQDVITALTEHFKADKQGQFAKKAGFFGDSTVGRGARIMALMAYAKVQELHANNPDLITLSLKEAPEDSDNQRLLQSMSEVLSYKELSELKDFNDNLIR